MALVMVNPASPVDVTRQFWMLIAADVVFSSSNHSPLASETLSGFAMISLMTMRWASAPQGSMASSAATAVARMRMGAEAMVVEEYRHARGFPYPAPISIFAQ